MCSILRPRRSRRPGRMPWGGSSSTRKCTRSGREVRGMNATAATPETGSTAITVINKTKPLDSRRAGSVQTGSGDHRRREFHDVVADLMMGAAIMRLWSQAQPDISRLLRCIIHGGELRLRASERAAHQGTITRTVPEGIEARRRRQESRGAAGASPGFSLACRGLTTSSP